MRQFANLYRYSQDIRGFYTQKHIPMKYKIILAILIAPVLFTSCKKDDAAETNQSSDQLYVRSLYSIVTGIVSIDWYYLGNDGAFVKNPKNGVQPINLEAEKKNNLQNTGTYSIHSSEGKPYIKITWASGSTTTMALKYENGDIVEMDILGTMIRQTGLPKGYKLNALYEGASTDLSFDFNSDGSFIFKDYDIDTYQWETFPGKYEITGNNLKLTFSDNSVVLCMIAILDDGNLIINREYYDKE